MRGYHKPTKNKVTYLDSKLQLPEYLHLNLLLRFCSPETFPVAPFLQMRGVNKGEGEGGWPGPQHSSGTLMCALCCYIIYCHQYGNLNMYLVGCACVGQEGYVLRRSADIGEGLSWLGFLLKIAWYRGMDFMVEGLRF